MFKKKKQENNEEQTYSMASDVWFRLKKNKVAMAGLIVIVIILLLSIFADLIADYNTLVIEQHPEIRLQKPSLRHIFGTDAFGRDLFARVIHGARYSMFFAIVCSALSIIGGGLLGATAAYKGGRIDNLIMRFLDAFMCLPGMLLTLSFIAAFGLGVKSMVIAMTISRIPGFARVARSVVLSVVREEYIEAARACGLGDFRIIVLHVLPNAIGTVIVNATMSMASIIMSAASLSFIGMGIQPPNPEWGAMLSEATQYMRLYPHIVLVPGLAILVTALSFNVLGDGLSEALDPRMKD